MNPIAANRATALVQKPSRLVERFHVAVDRQLKSGHQTFEAAEKVAAAIKRLHPQLHVTVYDSKEQRHTVIEQPKSTDASYENRASTQATQTVFDRHWPAVAGVEH
jgi:hypothetical protein